MPKVNSRLGQMFKKNFIFILTLVIILSTISFSIMIINSRKFNERQVNSIENEKLENLATLIKSRFLQVEKINAYFSTITMQSNTDNLTSTDVS